MRSFWYPSYTVYYKFALIVVTTECYDENPPLLICTKWHYKFIISTFAHQLQQLTWAVELQEVEVEDWAKAHFVCVCFAAKTCGLCHVRCCSQRCQNFEPQEGVLRDTWRCDDMDLSLTRLLHLRVEWIHQESVPLPAFRISYSTYELYNTTQTTRTSTTSPDTSCWYK